MKVPRLTLWIIAITILWLIGAHACMTFRIDDGKAIKQFNDSGVSISFKTMQIGKRHLHYAITGCDTGATILFIHGSPGSWDAYEKYLKDPILRAKYKLISIDRPGFGYSDFDHALPISVQCTMLQPLITLFQNKKGLYVVGHSLGGPLAVLLAAKYPESISGLLLLAASVDPNEEKPERWRPVLKAFPVRYFVPGAFRPSNVELWAFKKDVLFLPAALNSVKCPVIIMQGMEDPLVPPGNAFYAQEQLKQARSVKLIKLNGANHFIPWTRYNEIKTELIGLDMMGK